MKDHTKRKPRLMPVNNKCFVDEGIKWACFVPLEAGVGLGATPCEAYSRWMMCEIGAPFTKNYGYLRGKQHPAEGIGSMGKLDGRDLF